jgi:molecular chaperone IbpA
MREFDFSPLFRSAIGFDRFPSLIDAARRASESVDSFPPYNIEKAGEDSYRITMAVAGFGPEDLNVEIRDGVLYVTGAGAQEADKDTEYLYRGIARRAFERRFQLADHVEVKSADLVNGLLNIELKRELPEALKPRSIPINSTGASKVIEGKKAA